MYVGVYWCVHRRWSIERHRKSMDFGREGGCGVPYLAAPPTSARVQNSVKFVELARDMPSNCTGEVQARISRWYHSFQSVAPLRARLTCSMNSSAGIFDCVRTHCGVRMAYHTWYLGAGITYQACINIINIHILIPPREFVHRIYQRARTSYQVYEYQRTDPPKRALVCCACGLRP